MKVREEEDTVWKFTSYLQLGVVAREVGVVVPAGRHAVEEHVLGGAVVVVQEPERVPRGVAVMPRQPAWQSLRESQDRQQQQKPASGHDDAAPLLPPPQKHTEKS